MGFWRIKGWWRSVARARLGDGEQKWFTKTFHRHRRFLPPLLLQRKGPSTTLVAATAFFPSTMFIKRQPNSFFNCFQKPSKMQSSFFWADQHFLMVVKPLKQPTQIQKYVFRNLNLFVLEKLKNQYLTFWDFHNVGLWDRSYFHCLGSHDGVIILFILACFQITSRSRRRIRR